MGGTVSSGKPDPEDGHAPATVAGAASPAVPLVTLSAGIVRGEVSGSVASFEGLPFAVPPVGSLRWRKPQYPPVPWAGELDCTSARQARRTAPVQNLVAPPQRPESEDCLQLCVDAPAEALAAAAAGGSPKLPVLVGIYGGGLVGGSMYDIHCKQAYAARGVVYVRINYRVGMLGFLWPEGGDANCGLWDQVAALQWVKDEIAFFGGDPDNVTVTGQSAGADSTFWLCSSPAARGLFRRAIIQSPASFALTKAQSCEMTAEAAAVAGVASCNLEDMQAMTVEAVMELQLQGRFHISHSCGPGWRVLTQVGNTLPEAPPPAAVSNEGLFRHSQAAGWTMPVATIDGEFLTEQPLDALAGGAAAELEIVIGGNRDEDAFVPLSAEKPDTNARGSFGLKVSDGQVGREQTRRWLAWELAGMPGLQGSESKLEETVGELSEAFEAERIADPYGLGPTGNATTAEQWLQDTLSSDIAFLTAVQLIAERLGQPGNCKRVFRYQFNGYGGKGDACHGAEMELLIGNGPRRGKAEVRDQWLDSWAAFVHTGDPNIPAMAGTWRPYAAAAGQRQAMFWDGLHGFQDGQERVAARPGLRAAAALWERLWDLKPSAKC